MYKHEWYTSKMQKTVGKVNDKEMLKYKHFRES